MSFLIEFTVQRLKPLGHLSLTTLIIFNAALYPLATATGYLRHV
jgi:hypothetical protein